MLVRLQKLKVCHSDTIIINHDYRYWYYISWIYFIMSYKNLIDICGKSDKR